MSPKVSVLIPVYNRAIFISDCLKSAINQTFKDIEIIVVDNASTDGTWDICQKYVKKDSRVKAYRNKYNLGPVNNWRECLKHANGIFIKVLFSDDLLLPECVEKMYNNIIKNDKLGFVYSRVLMGETLAKSRIKYCNKKKVLNPNEYFRGLLTGKTPVSPGAILINRKDLKKNLSTQIETSKQWDYNKNGAGPDAMIMLRQCAQNKLVGYIDDALVFFRIHESGITVMNEGDQVMGAYTSVFCYYAKTYISWICWINTISLLWVKNIIIKRKYIYLCEFIKTNEGKGNITEVIAAILLMPTCILKIYKDYCQQNQ